MKNKVGRPLKFKSPEELEKKINEFREYCKEKGRLFEATMIFSACVTLVGSASWTFVLSLSNHVVVLK